jgi:hypothetical protein
MGEFGYASFKQYVEAVVLPNSVPGSSSSGTYQTVLRRLNGLQYNLYVKYRLYPKCHSGQCLTANPQLC